MKTFWRASLSKNYHSMLGIVCVCAVPYTRLPYCRSWSITLLCWLNCKYHHAYESRLTCIPTTWKSQKYFNRIAAKTRLLKWDLPVVLLHHYALALLKEGLPQLTAAAAVLSNNFTQEGPTYCPFIVLPEHFTVECAYSSHILRQSVHSFPWHHGPGPFQLGLRNRICYRDRDVDLYHKFHNMDVRVHNFQLQVLDTHDKAVRKGTPPEFQGNA